MKFIINSKTNLKINLTHPFKKLFSTLVFAALFMVQGVYAKEVQLRVNGLTLNADLVLAEGKSLKDGVVLFTHGTWMNSRYSTATMLKNNLSELGINVLAINLSLGQDNRHDVAMVACDKMQPHKHTDALKEIDVWVKWLEKQGVTNITLAGHSRGGNQTAWYAAEHNEDKAIKRVVLLAPQLWTAEAEAKTYQKKYHKSLAPILAEAQKWVDAGKGAHLMKSVDFVYCANIPMTASGFVDYYQHNPKMDTLYLLPKIKKPVLVFSGTEDTVVHDLAQKIDPIVQTHANIKHYEVEDATHSFTDFAGEEVAEKIKAFINPS